MRSDSARRPTTPSRIAATGFARADRRSRTRHHPDRGGKETAPGAFFSGRSDTRTARASARPATRATRSPPPPPSSDPRVRYRFRRPRARERRVVASSSPTSPSRHPPRNTGRARVVRRPSSSAGEHRSVGFGAPLASLSENVPARPHTSEVRRPRRPRAFASRASRLVPLPSGRDGTRHPSVARDTKLTRVPRPPLPIAGVAQTHRNALARVPTQGIPRGGARATCRGLPHTPGGCTPA